MITGGPGSGKTTLIQFLEKKGFAVLHEISRQITLEAQKQGTDQLFLKDPLLFSRKLLEGRIEQFHQAEASSPSILFYDRGIGDVSTYLDFAAISYSEEFSEPILKYRYDRIFILPPWKDIYQSDNERYENFEQANEIFHFLKKTYTDYGYRVYEVPIGTVEERTHFILDALKDLM